jgi:hypothetical protein
MQDFEMLVLALTVAVSMPACVEDVDAPIPDDPAADEAAVRGVAPDPDARRLRAALTAPRCYCRFARS